MNDCWAVLLRWQTVKHQKFVSVWPVEGVAHLNGDQHRQGHGHGRSSLKHLTFNSSKVLIFIMALHEVRLNNKGKGLNAGIMSLWCVFFFSMQIRKIKLMHQSSDDKDLPADSRSLWDPHHHTGTNRLQHQQWQRRHILKGKRNSFCNHAKISSGTNYLIN